jgi:hypothetical protein
MASSRTDALIRDIAQLFVKYPSAVWQSVVDQLARGGDTQNQITDAIRTLIAEAERVKNSAIKQPIRQKNRIKSRTGGKKANTLAVSAKSEPALIFSQQRSETLNALHEAIMERRLLPIPADLREVFLKSGGKGDLPKTRKAASLTLLSHLDTVSEDIFNLILIFLRDSGNNPDDTETYSRWFKLIRITG